LQFDTLGELDPQGITPFIIESVPVGPFKSPADYYESFIQKYIEEGQTRSEEEREIIEVDASLYRRVIEQINFASGPYPLMHWDFGQHNILIDDEGNVVAEIDWTYSRVSP